MSVKDPLQNMKLMHEDHELVGQADRGKLSRKKRKCDVCADVFIKKSICNRCI